MSPMTAIETTNRLFFDNSDLEPEKLTSILEKTLESTSDGELYFEYSLSEGLVLDDGRIRSASYDTDAGFGFRAVAGDITGFAHSSDLSENAIRRAGESISAVTKGYGGTATPTPLGTNQKLYISDNPLECLSFEKKVALLESVDLFARAELNESKTGLCLSFRLLEGGANQTRRRFRWCGHSPSRSVQCFCHTARRR